MVEVVRRAEVKFLVPGAGVLIETYSLDNEEDLFCWSANERLTKAIQIHAQPVEFITMTDEEYKELKKTRAAMGGRVSERIAAERNKMQREAAG